MSVLHRGSKHRNPGDSNPSCSIYKLYDPGQST